MPNFTFFHPTPYVFQLLDDLSEDFPTFYNAITADMETYKDVKGIKICRTSLQFSVADSVRRTAFTGLCRRCRGRTARILPIVVMGRYEKMRRQGQYAVVNITIARRGGRYYYAGLFFRHSQAKLDAH